MLEASSTNQLFQRKCLESFYIDHDLFIFLVRCLFIATLECSRASLAPRGRNLCLVLWVGVTKMMCKFGLLANKKYTYISFGM